jgi:phage terminase large subunit
MDVYSPAVVITTAPTERQVKKIIWEEIAQVHALATKHSYPLPGTLKASQARWEVEPGHYAMGFNPPRNADTATLFQGIHSPNILVIADEAAGVLEGVYEGIESILRGANAKLLLIGNPTVLQGSFYRAFKSEYYQQFSISAFDSPNLQGEGVKIPGLITEQDVAEARDPLLGWGEGSFLWVSRILGLHPESLSDSLIPVICVEWAAAAELDPEGPVEVGVDVARRGADESVFVARQGPVAIHYHSHAKLDTMETAQKLAQFIEQVEADIVKIGGQGVDAGVLDRMKELRREKRVRPVRLIEVNVSAKAKDQRKYADWGTEMWGMLADLLKAREISGKVFGEKRAMAQLTQRPMEYTPKGQIKLVPKEDMRKKGLESPDWGDAIAAAFAPADPFGFKTRQSLW